MCMPRRPEYLAILERRDVPAPFLPVHIRQQRSVRRNTQSVYVLRDPFSWPGYVFPIQETVAGRRGDLEVVSWPSEGIVARTSRTIPITAMHTVHSAPEQT